MTDEILTPTLEPGEAVNSAGGVAFALDDWGRLDRLLILGTDSGTYYATKEALATENDAVVRRCVALDGPLAVAKVVEVSVAGRAPKNGPAIRALALCAEFGDAATKPLAYAAVAKVCCTATHLFEFAATKKELGGAFGAGMRRAVGRWYTTQSADQLAYQVVKYRSRAGFTHRDLLRLARPAGTPEVDAVLRWCVKGGGGLGGVAKAPPRGTGLPARAYGPAGALPATVAAFDELQELARAEGGLTVADAVRFVGLGLPWECLPSESLTSPQVWEALLPLLPLTALVRNLATMTRAGVLSPDSAGERIVAEKLADRAALRKARLHPMAILLALKTYAAGRGFRSDATWTPNPAVVAALDGAFYAAFQDVSPSGARHYLALDVSGSMAGSTIAGSPLTAREASVAMALVTRAAEPGAHVAGFQDRLVPLELPAGVRLDRACEVVNGLSFGATDCARPMLDALTRGLEIDLFVVYTDSETWAGDVKPVEALVRYREATGIPARLAVVGLTSTGFTIADPADSGMLDVVGFDAATPALLGWFAGGDGANSAGEGE